MKTRLLLLLLLLTNCTESIKTLPRSTGAYSEVIFVVENKLWEKSVASLAKNTFGKNIEGINQSEPLFSIIHVNKKEFKSILKTHKSIIIISENAEKSSQKNKWAKNQFVVQLNWDNNSAKLLEELKQVRSIYVLKEVASKRKILEINSQKNTEKSLFKNFGVECIIPKEYQVIKNDSTIFWANYDPDHSDEIKNLILFSFEPKSQNLQEEILEKSDSVFAKYLIGEKQGSFVRIEPQYPPYYFNNNYRGLWKLENGFMGGPFLIKTYFVNNKVIVNAGLVFAPQSSKRKYIKEFEAIL